MRIALIANTSWYLANFRLGFMQSLREAGHEVLAIAPPDGAEQRIVAAGFAHVPFELQGKSINPWRELRSVVGLRRVLREQQPELLITHTPKGNLYTALARSGLKQAQIAGVSGLGSSFIRQNWLTQVVKLLYRLTFGRMHRVFFENLDDRELFLRQGFITEEKAVAIPGLGVDLEHFAAAPWPGSTPPVFLMVARLLGDKGVREYAAAAGMLRAKRPELRFQLLGGLWAGNPSAIAQSELDEWVTRGDIEYLGHVGDVRPVIAGASCVVLPSYREGMSRTLLEAAAMARPLVATDVPGCREAVEPGLNGYLCLARDVASLAKAMEAICQHSDAALQAMGQASRRKVEAEFAEAIVTARYLRAVSELPARAR